MKKQNNQHRQIILQASIATIILLGAFSSVFAQKGIGAKYGARDPIACADKSQPRTGAISAEKAKEYFGCTEGVFGSNIYLFDEVAIRQMGSPRRYNANEDINFPNIDVRFPLYPIRGSFKQYQCGLVSDYMGNAGKNCNLYDQPNATGYCYKDSFSDWQCRMQDVNGQLLSQGVPPPGGAPQANKIADGKAAQNTKPAAAEQPGIKAEAADRDENGYPKPDLSSMDKWYEITKVEYGDLATDQTLHFLFNPKVGHMERGNPNLRFEAHYLDKDGVLVGSYPVYADYNTEPGEIGKGSAQTPSEKEMAKVVSVKIVRLKQ